MRIAYSVAQVLITQYEIRDLSSLYLKHLILSLNHLPKRFRQALPVQYIYAKGEV